LWSTYLGGNQIDSGSGVDVDRWGNVYVTGSTTSAGWVSGGFDESHNGNWDVYVAKLSASRTSARWATPAR
jgi:hypothetical protein